MKRIAVIGNGGGGKSTLSRAIGERFGLPVHEVDPVQFQPGWSQTPLDEVERTLDTWIAGDAWIVDGFGPWPAIERRFDAADTIIWIDFPLHVHLRWTAKRQLFWQTTADGRRRPPTILMFRTILRVHRKLRPLLAASLASREPKVVHLRSPRELRAFLEDARAER